jgi:hypothetical protein
MAERWREIKGKYPLYERTSRTKVASERLILSKIVNAVGAGAVARSDPLLKASKYLPKRKGCF